MPPEQQLYPECWLSTLDVRCSCSNGKLEVAITVRAEGAVYRQTAAQGIDTIELGGELVPADPEISLRIYYAQAGEEVFSIARRFHVSPAQMVAANGLEEGTEVLPQPRHFLVPGT